MADAIPILLDTDIGSDIDDALALAYLLRQPRCELLGITTVTGDVAKRAALAQMLCEAAGRDDVPIRCGASEVLLSGPGQPRVPQYDAVRSLPHRLDWPKATAVDFLRETVRRRPGEITLLSIGPLTNVALLFALDPAIPALLKSWVSMGGEFSPASERAEWNCACDPVSTAVAFRARPPRRVHVGLDVTLRCRMPAAEVRPRLKGPLLGLVLQMAEVWFARRAEVVFHDPLAAALPFKPGLCRLERGTVAVDPGSGRTSFMPLPDGEDEVATDVDTEAFFEEFLGVFR